MLLAALLLAPLATALPGPAATSTPPSQAAPTTTTTTTAGPVSLPAVCDYSYCDGRSSWCFYWAGITSYDISRGPVPGETRVPLGPCGDAVTTTTTARG
ncbi:hypothetical protein CDD80_3458 [Ophiocordyceps camponoti-rufipedis]|uniref:Uncharacterized protein n=1 Tax=Ophiocordyceps camponoti-rufipedis TaxID=2004952 RepID=A0A2C5Z3I9_9HYPO|nr:hypothetical protein CDD80_3458 [Ophiocordyceps camponoti-rufipedis]